MYEKQRARRLSLLLSLAVLLGLSTPAGAGHTAKAGAAQTLGGLSSQTGVIDRRGTLWEAGMSRPEGFSPVLDQVASVSCGDGHTAVIKMDGTLWTWGSNQEGQLGNGEGEYYYTEEPARVMSDVAAVSCGGAYTAAIRTDGTLWVWGDNYIYDQLGLGTQNDTGEDVRVPTQVIGDVTAVSCGQHHTAAIKTDGTLWTWGRNTEGQLGLGYRDYRGDHAPAPVMENVAAVCCGPDCTAAIQSDGSLWVWGNITIPGACEGDAAGDYGVKLQTAPRKILEDVAAVSCGGGYIAALKTDGTLWTGGARMSGQTGTGAYGVLGSDPLSQVLDEVEAVHCAHGHTVARRKDGSLWAWGTNYHGELGFWGGNVTGSVPLQSVPTQTRLPQTAYPATQAVSIDGKPVTLQAYALKNAAGYLTNYVKARDLALALDGTAAQFNVNWNGTVELWPQTPYTTRNGQENNAPYTGERSYTDLLEPTRVNGELVALDAFTLTDENGGSSTYYKLRDLGQALGFYVDWSTQRGVFIETDTPASAAK